MFYDEKYDVIVVGAGPGGSIAAKEAAEKGLKVLLLERHRKIGTPVRCAEAAGVKGLLEFFDKDHWIIKRYSRKFKIRFVAPNGTPLDLHHESEAAVLDRQVFDYELGREAGLAGATVVTLCNVVDLIKDEDQIKGVEVIWQDKKYKIESNIVIGADGIETRVGRWAGINTTPKYEDLESCVQYTMTNIDIDKDRFDFYFGKDCAPSGYLWVFPKDDKTANIGLGVSGPYSEKKKAVEYLNEFIEKEFPNGSIISTTCGGVICSETLDEISGNGFMIVGDAAHQTNAISGGGIINAMKAGRIAAATAVKACAESDFSKKSLSRYDKGWYKKQGKMNHKFKKLSKATNSISDEVLNKTTDKLNTLPLKKRTLVSVFKHVLINQPKLILDLPKMFS